MHDVVAGAGVGWFGRQGHSFGYVAVFYVPRLCELATEAMETMAKGHGWMGRMVQGEN